MESLLWLFLMEGGLLILRPPPQKMEDGRASHGQRRGKGGTRVSGQALPDPPLPLALNDLLAHWGCPMSIPSFPAPQCPVPGNVPRPPPSPLNCSRGDPPKWVRPGIPLAHPERVLAGGSTSWSRHLVGWGCRPTRLAASQEGGLKGKEAAVWGPASHTLPTGR